jgi:hypothetical protein
VHSWGAAINYFDCGSDEENLRTGLITIHTCAATIVQMVDFSFFKRFRCGACPVGCADRAIKMYIANRPTCTLADYARTLFCTWALRQFETNQVSWQQYEHHLLPFDFPELMNETSGFIPNRNFSHGKLFNLTHPLLTLVMNSLVLFYCSSSGAGHFRGIQHAVQQNEVEQAGSYCHGHRGGSS